MEKISQETPKETFIPEEKTLPVAPKSNKKIWIILIIVAALIFCCVALTLVGIFVVLPKFNQMSQVIGPTTTTSETNTNVTPTSTNMSEMMSMMSEKNVNEFFPNSFNTNTISPLGIDDYLVGPIDGNYKKAGATATDPVAETKGIYYANYIPSSAVTDTAKKAKNILIAVYKFTDDSETSDAIKVSDSLFTVMSDGYSSTTMPIEGLTYWAAYKSIPDSQAGTVSAGDARVLFPQANIMVLFNVGSGYSKTEFQNIVKSYLDTISNSSTDYVGTSTIMTLDDYQNYLDSQKN